MCLSNLLSATGLLALLIFSDTSHSENMGPGLAEVESSSSARSSMQASFVSSQESRTENSIAGPTASSSAVETSFLAPFTTDGCSMWIDGLPNQPWLWRHCCVAHDRIYWIGGTEEERRKSDQGLQKCIADVAGKFMGNVMYLGVMPGGSPYWVTPYRWGYGWNYFDSGKLRGYKNLSEEELLQVNALIPDAEKTIAQDAIEHPADSKLRLQQ